MAYDKIMQRVGHGIMTLATYGMPTTVVNIYTFTYCKYAEYMSS